MGKTIPWEGQVFVISVENPNGEVERYFDFHVNILKNKLEGGLAENRLQKHITEIRFKRAKQFPGCSFLGEILTEDEWKFKETQFRKYWATKIVKKSDKKVKIYTEPSFKEIIEKRFDICPELDKEIPF